MKKKLLLISIIISLVFFGCKKATKINSTGVIDSSKINNITTQSQESIQLELYLDEDCINQREITSMTHSCGGGCAISYSEKKISTVDSLIKAEFNYTFYQNEEIQEEGSSFFYIRCKNEVAIKVFDEGFESENLIEVASNGANLSYKEYSDKLCKCLRTKLTDK